MNKHSRLWRPCFSGLALAALLSLTGCTSSLSHPPLHGSPAESAALNGALLVQTSPVYQHALDRYARHDYQGAFALIQTLSAQPQISRDAAARAFLGQQARICRHALDPRVSLNPVLDTPHPAAVTARRADCGPRALLLVCKHEGVQANLTALTREAGTTARGTTMAGMAQAARAHGFRAVGVQVDPQALSQLASPALAWVEADHYVAVLSVDHDQAVIHDPNQPKEETISTSELWSRCGGVLLTLSR